MNQNLARVEKVFPLTESIIQLILLPDEYIDYQAGQYLKVILENEELSFSIANAPLGSKHYELHIRHSPENPSTKRLLAEIKKQGELTINLPFGACTMEALNPNSPILFIAGGTGFAPVKAMIEQLLASSDPRSFELFWGARSKNDLYWGEALQHWHTHTTRFQNLCLLSEGANMSLAPKVLAQHQGDLALWQLVLSGPFDMVYRLRDTFYAAGVPLDRMYSDAFAFEPTGE
jgi:CDP-4-dehydro-6-deoxyglucose reductase